MHFWALATDGTTPGINRRGGRVPRRWAHRLNMFFKLFMYRFWAFWLFQKASFAPHLDSDAPSEERREAPRTSVGEAYNFVPIGWVQMLRAVTTSYRVHRCRLESSGRSL